ncbi:hypothetical protein [Salana multivorans]
MAVTSLSAGSGVSGGGELVGDADGVGAGEDDDGDDDGEAVALAEADADGDVDGVPEGLAALELGSPVGSSPLGVVQPVRSASSTTAPRARRACGRG